MPLTLGPLNQEIIIRNVVGDLKTKKRLESLGIVKDTKITILSSTLGGVVIALNNSRLALDNDIAKNIII